MHPVKPCLAGGGKREGTAAKRSISCHDTRLLPRSYFRPRLNGPLNVCMLVTISNLLMSYILRTKPRPSPYFNFLAFCSPYSTRENIWQDASSAEFLAAAASISSIPKSKGLPEVRFTPLSDPFLTKSPDYCNGFVNTILSA